MNRPNNSLFELGFENLGLEQFFTDKLSFDEVLAIFGTPEVYTFDLLKDGSIEHKVVGKLADFSPLDHLLVYVVDTRLMLVLKIVEYSLDVLPSDLFLHHAAILNIEYHFLD